MNEELDKELTELLGALSPEECKVIDKLLNAYHMKNKEILMIGSKVTDLANKITELCHGKDSSYLASKTAENVFKHGELDINLPTRFIHEEDLKNDIGIIQLFIMSGLVKSGKEAKRLISENGARINDELIKTSDYRLQSQDFENPVKLSAGKKRHVLLKING